MSDRIDPDERVDLCKEIKRQTGYRLPVERGIK